MYTTHAVDQATVARRHAIKEYTILVPLANNRGAAFAPEVFAALEAELLSLAGGFTRQDGMVGFWRSPDGEVFSDRLCSYTVALAARDARATIVAIARRWCVALEQEAMYVRLPGGSAEIVTPDGG